MAEHVQKANRTCDKFFRYKVTSSLSYNLAICMLRAARLEMRPEKFENWLTKREKTELRELPMFKDPEPGARFLESLVGNGGTETFQDLVSFLESEKRKLKGESRRSLNLNRPPYCYLGRLPTENEMNVLRQTLCSLYRSRYQSYWEEIFPLLEEKCSQLEKILQGVNPAGRLVRFSRLPTRETRQHRLVQVFALDQGGPAFTEEAGTFIPIDPYEPEIPVHRTAYIMAHELCHRMAFPEDWRQKASIRAATSRMPMPDSAFGALEEAIAHFMGATVAQSIGNERGGWGNPRLHGRCLIHIETGKTLARLWPEFLRGDIRDIMSLCERCLSDLQRPKAPPKWRRDAYEMARWYAILYDEKGNPTDIRIET